MSPICAVSFVIRVSISEERSAKWFFYFFAQVEATEHITIPKNSQISATNKTGPFSFYTQGKKEGIQPPSNSWNSQMCLHFSFVSKNQLQKHPAQINLNLTLAIVSVAERSKRELVGGGNLKIDDEVFFFPR